MLPFSLRAKPRFLLQPGRRCVSFCVRSRRFIDPPTQKVTSAAKQPSQRVWHETFAIPFPATMTLETMRAKLRYEGGKRFDVGTCKLLT